MKELFKNEAKKDIDDYFSKEKLEPEKTRKIKKLAMSYRIRLGNYRKRFCKKCFNDLREGKTRISKTSKTIICQKCNSINRFTLS